MACPVRTYPRKQPPKWKPPVPRWQLVLPSGVEAVYTLYVGVQKHESSSTAALSKAIAAIESWLDSPSTEPSVVDAFVTETGHDLPGTRVWVCYWTDRNTFNSALSKLNLVKIYHSLNSARKGIGLWTESFTTPIRRLETNYAGLHESPGIARLPDTTREEHTLSAYWGAARDRLPGSSSDIFELPGTDPPDNTHDPENAKTHPTERLTTVSDAEELQLPDPVPKGLGQRLTGVSYDNMVHIRSGQCWEQCQKDEAEAYEEKLQKSLMKGMQYLWDNAAETGTLGLRWLRNVVPVVDEGSGVVNGNHAADGDDTSQHHANATKVREINETCGAGFFRNLRDLELWSSSHPTHKAIFAGAHTHAREWGEARKFMTWHEVSVLKRGEARWEYVNCDPRTGVVRFVKMEGVEDL